MDESRYDLAQKPPWAGQIVRPWVRFLACVFILCAVLAFAAGTYFYLLDGGVGIERFPIILLFVFGEVYFVALLLHVAIRGVAPSSWLPWK